MSQTKRILLNLYNLCKGKDRVDRILLFLSKLSGHF